MHHIKQTNSMLNIDEIMRLNHMINNNSFNIINQKNIDGYLKKAHICIEEYKLNTENTQNSNNRTIYMKKF